MLNEHRRIARALTKERRVLTSILHKAPVIEDLLRRHRCEGMTRGLSNYNEEMTREFYASYATTAQNSISKWAMPVAQPPLQSTLMWGFQVDISEATICRFIYGPAHTLPINTIEYDYKICIVQSGSIQRDADQRETLLRWMERYIAEDGECTEWVQNPTLSIRKVTLSFAVKFFCLLVRNRHSPTQADNVVTWDRAVMKVAIMAGLEIDFAHILIAEIHKRAFKNTTTLPFPCLIFHLCREASVPIWHCDRLLEVTKTLDIDLIRDDANPVSPWMELKVDVPHLDVDLTADVEQIQADDSTIPAPTTDTQAPPSSATSQALSSS
uniref:Integrase core domain containing protein n=1 Tax=Solanum tuberosum TaxID=4113 RepID=M1D9B9_SOLTU